VTKSRYAYRMERTRINLTSRVPLNPTEERFRSKLQATVQTALDHMSDGADYRIHGPVISTLCQQWLASSDHGHVFI
jgi:hypothetical protein